MKSDGHKNRRRAVVISPGVISPAGLTISDVRQGPILGTSELTACSAKIGTYLELIS